MKDERCPDCRFRGALPGIDIMCNYMTITGLSRLAQETPADRGQPCRFYEPGVRKDLRAKLSNPMPRRDRRFFEQAKLRALYDAGLSDHEIARRAGCQRRTVQKFRERNGLPNNWGRHAREDAIRKFYMAGLTDPEVAARVGCHANTVYHWRKTNGLPANYRRTETGGEHGQG